MIQAKEVTSNALVKNTIRTPKQTNVDAPKKESKKQTNVDAPKKESKKQTNVNTPKKKPTKNNDITPAKKSTKNITTQKQISKENEIRKVIDSTIQELQAKNVTKVYGGQTEDLEVREKQHKKESYKFRGMRVIDVGITKNPNVANRCETYLINQLDKFFGKSKCINDYNDDGKIRQSGGVGSNHQEGDIHHLYIMYKP
ncbi:hypothetical protein Klosneuvirus_8_16 [Klosneuvirus KNV1]|uniref:Uncharacterized protein n=1 Tax=Klosneuvirus KNV1 TaxID=1977640 RepID=A0A1V0SLJ9_9VIRU|nr:hypothetical protein Klosneuvirus_8_16 [Klosneuvirus KNV1]